jgi:hypothetical protein
MSLRWLRYAVTSWLGKRVDSSWLEGLLTMVVRPYPAATVRSRLVRIGAD